MSKRLTWWVGLSLILAFCANYGATVAFAETIQSPNYRLDESVVGAGGLNESSSTNYQASNATGDISIGHAASATYQVEAGSKTTNDPALSFSFSNSNANFGSFSPSSASVSTATFSISNYTSFGYVVQIVGSPPKNGSSTINAMATTGDSQTGVEQFGLNLVANTVPTSVGSNLNNGQFGFGSVASNYGTSNKYRYVSGETIALASKSSGMTTYTITYLVNVTSLTPGGQYASNQTIIITGTY